MPSFPEMLGKTFLKCTLQLAIQAIRTIRNHELIYRYSRQDNSCLSQGKHNSDWWLDSAQGCGWRQPADIVGDVRFLKCFGTVSETGNVGDFVQQFCWGYWKCHGGKNWKCISFHFVASLQFQSLKWDRAVWSFDKRDGHPNFFMITKKMKVIKLTTIPKIYGSQKLKAKWLAAILPCVVMSGTWQCSNSINILKIVLLIA